nr:(Fe-S)-binding protein [Thiocystis violacea]
MADQCVKCGYCLPHCPTYVKTRNEADSPRGRIALIQGWVSGELEMSPAMARHLDGCLTCRACETACPSLVAYGRLADGAKARRTARQPAWRRITRRLGLHALSHARVMQAIGRLAKGYNAIGLARLAERLSIHSLHRLAAYHRIAAALSRTARPSTPRDPRDSRLDLFIGCMGSSAQGAAVQAAIRVCERLDLNPRVSADSDCCGALMRHNGFPEEADRYRAAVARAHAGRPLVGLSSACVAELKEHPQLRETQEICAFLESIDWPPTLQLKRLERTVAVHEPCSHRNLLGGVSAVYDLLKRIPGIQVAPLAGNDQCCGAAGTYLLQQPAMAARLLEDKLTAARRAHPDILVTTNPGCALHLIAGFHEAGLEIEVCHPIELIARQLPE